uniref:S-adenosylmethionine decarboxylase proenzyme n=1 Tax=Plectus sambesii TaxID=2011161 RepID=A0A914VN07_9BILA
MSSSSISLPSLEGSVASRSPSPSSTGPDHYFEGAEKLLEIWFHVEPTSKSLRVIPYNELTELLDLAHCQIISSRSNEKVDAYVLSESSCFVSDSRFILKTCGTTRLLDTVGRLLDLAREYCGLNSVLNVYYSRKNFARPELQIGPHGSFEHEIARLDDHFEDGAAYCMGSLKQDRWYLYTLHSPVAPQRNVDHTLELLMTDLPEEVCALFTKEVCADGPECTKLAGIDKLVPPGTIIDETLFDPVGYSMNGLLPHSDHYVTIHVTPEPEFSYVSFETNQDLWDLYKQANKVLDCFKPKKFQLTLFASDESPGAKASQQHLWERDIPGYRRTDLQFIRLAHDTLVYAQFKQKVNID